MKLNVISLGNRMPIWVYKAFEEYARRLPRELNLHLIEIPLAKRSNNKQNMRQLLHHEATAVLASIPQDNYIIALDVRGTQWNSEQLALQLERWRQSRQDVSFIIGGPDGLSPEVLTRAHHKWSVSPLTFPHSIMRIIIAEQLYRAWSILVGHPYHR